MNSPLRPPTAAKKPAAPGRQRSGNPEQTRSPKSQRKTASSNAAAPIRKNGIPGNPMSLMLEDENAITRPSSLLKKLGQGFKQLEISRGKARDKDAPAASPEQAVATDTEKKAETQFFGIQAQGGCFAFILDISLSMAGERLAYCKRELIQALNGLPEHASFGVFLYADTVYTPSGQNNWFHADPFTVQQISAWVSSIGVKPYTRPAPAFRKAFSYPTPPNVIFFLTDGELFRFTARTCGRITGARSPGFIKSTLTTLFTNREPGPVPVIHTIALGDEASTGVLKQIADDHGGSYRVIH